MLLRILRMGSQSISVLSVGILSRCKVSRKAVFLPMPGKVAKELTESSISFDEKFMY